MLAQHRERPFSEEGWLFELKHDGFRLLASRGPSGVRLFYRRGSEVTAAYPELAAPLLALPVSRVLLDGEVVILGPDGRARFQALQTRALVGDRAQAARAARLAPVVYYAFDLLGLADLDLRPLPLRRRKALLFELLEGGGALRHVDHVETDGEALFAEVERLGLEGMVAKRADSPYRAGRHPDWRKVRVERSGDFVVVGLSRGNSRDVGGLHLAARARGRLVYAGRVGSGLGEDVLARIRALFAPLQRPDAPCAGPVPMGRGHVWVDPRVVCSVRYREWTEEGLLRQPVFLGFRPDKGVADCTGAPRHLG